MSIEKLNKKLVMTLLVRDEQDIVEQCIKFHLSQGVDFIIATDNGSIDETRNILLKYQQQGVLELIDEPEHNYNQDIWVDRMIRIAKEKYEADWIINVDADEFWFSHYGNLKLSLPSTKSFNVIYVPAIQVDPIDSFGKYFEIPKSVSGIVSGIFKCMHTAKGYQKISMGNHGVKMKRACRRAMNTLDIIIFHFSIRSYAHYERKVIISVKAFDNNPRFNKGTGDHIRKSYELYQQGKLRDEYEALKTRYINDERYIKEDSRLYDFINNGYKSIEGASSKIFGIYNSAITRKAKNPLSRLLNSISKRF